jgi:pyridoxal phosphate enzyme (YggS family)
MNENELRDRLRANLERVGDAITEACGWAGRSADVEVVAVTKSVDVPVIRTLLELGITNLGENRVQQLVQRAVELASVPGIPQLRWHMIGHLQRNKVKSLLAHSQVIHSVDSSRLALEIQRQAAAAGLTVEVLIEVNVSGEASKEGIAPAEAENLAREIEGLPNLNLRGLMTMAPLGLDADAARPHFAGLRRLLFELCERGAVGRDCDELSMGMSGDFRVAVEEGATIVRLGSILFEGLGGGLVNASK